MSAFSTKAELRKIIQLAELDFQAMKAAIDINPGQAHNAWSRVMLTYYRERSIRLRTLYDEAL